MRLVGLFGKFTICCFCSGWCSLCFFKGGTWWSNRRVSVLHTHNRRWCIRTSRARRVHFVRHWKGKGAFCPAESLLERLGWGMRRRRHWCKSLLGSSPANGFGVNRWIWFKYQMSVANISAKRLYHHSQAEKCSSTRGTTHLSTKKFYFLSFDDLSLVRPCIIAWCESAVLKVCPATSPFILDWERMCCRTSNRPVLWKFPQTVCDWRGFGNMRRR